jgi:single-strand DNA-binding protein
MSINKVFLIGNLGQDPDVRYTQSGQPMARLRMATNERWTDKSGQKQERTEWHTVVLWGKQAEFASEYLKKGRLVFVEGSIQTRQYKDKSGQDRTSFEIRGIRIVPLGGRGEQTVAHADEPVEEQEPQVADGPVPDDDIPF